MKIISDKRQRRDQLSPVRASVTETGLCALLCLAIVSCSQQDDESKGALSEVEQSSAQAGSAPPVRPGNQSAGVTATPRSTEPAPRSPESQQPTDPEPLVYTPLPDIDLPEEAMQDLHEEQDDALRAQRTTDIWRTWDDVMQQDNPREVGLTAAALGDGLRAAPRSPVHREIAERLHDPMSSIEERLALVETLEFAASPESVRVLFEYLGTLSDAASQDDPPEDLAYLAARVREAIQIAVRTPVDDAPNWAVSDSLETAWPEVVNTGSDTDLAMIADGLAVLGTESGTRMLVETALVETSEDTASALAAQKAIRSLTSIDAVAVLRDGLTKAEALPEAKLAFLEGLIAIGVADAGVALVDYLNNAEEMTEEQITHLELAMRERHFPEETRKVFRQALLDSEIRSDWAADLVSAAVAEEEPNNDKK